MPILQDEYSSFEIYKNYAHSHHSKLNSPKIDILNLLAANLNQIWSTIDEIDELSLDIGTILANICQTVGIFGSG